MEKRIEQEIMMLCDSENQPHQWIGNGKELIEILKSKETFEDVTSSVIDWMERNCNPHNTIIISQSSAELVSGEKAFVPDKYKI